MSVIFNSYFANFLSQRIAQWLQRMSDGLQDGRYRFCSKGSLVPENGRQGLVATCFAGKIARNIGIWEKLPISQREAITSFIKSFQDSDGFFRDPWVLQSLAKIKQSDEEIKQTIIAETRQALSFLLTVGSFPTHEIPLSYTEPEAMQQFIRALPWENPWAACSHFSHQCFFLSARKQAGQNVPQDIEQVLLDELFQHYHPDSGSWYSYEAPRPSTENEINGMMKVFTGLAWLDGTAYERINGQKAWDFATDSISKNDSCSMLNQLYVLSELKKNFHIQSTKLIDTFCSKYILRMLPYFHFREGAFSFFPKKSQITYYGAQPSTGEACADLHGTVMQTWAIALLFTLRNVRCAWTPQQV